MASLAKFHRGGGGWKVGFSFLGISGSTSRGIFDPLLEGTLQVNCWLLVHGHKGNTYFKPQVGHPSQMQLERFSLAAPVPSALSSLTPRSL